MENRTTIPSAERRPFAFTGRIRSFRYAIRGLVQMGLRQHNAWLHAAATIVTVAAGSYFQIAKADWCWLVLCMSLVWTAEALNTAIELIADVASPAFHPVVRDAKDVAAGAVLITAAAALVIGGIVFWPYLQATF